MTQIHTKIVADSIANNSRITTFELSYPRYIHSEFMTHRLFSRNASSSRAIPTSRLIAAAEETGLAIPDNFYVNQKGMYGVEFLSDKKAKIAQVLLRTLWQVTKVTVLGLDKLGLHKQHKNRYLEPFSNITVLCTSTDWVNFISQRTAPDAQPEIRELASRMLVDLQSNTPNKLDENDWHLPYNPTDIYSSIAACARVSYRNHFGKTPTKKEDKDLYDFLWKSRHMSPFEHAARPMSTVELKKGEELTALLLKGNSDFQELFNDPFIIGNFYKWVSFRRVLEGGPLPNT